MKEIADYDKIKTDIIKAAGEIYLKYGFIRTSMQDISNASGKGRSTLYHYFKNKEEVLDAFALAIFTEIFEKSQMKIKVGAAFKDNMEAYYSTKLYVLRRFLKQYHVLIDDVKVQPALFINKATFFFDKEVGIIMQIIEWGILQNDISTLSAEDGRFLAETLVTAFQSFEQGMFLFGKFSDFESKLSWLTRMLARGLR